MAKSGLKIALVGGDTLLGREMEDTLKRVVQGATVMSYASTGEGSFAAGDDEEAVYIEPLSAASLAEVQTVVLTGSTRDGALKVYDLVTSMQRKPMVLDCTGFLEGKPEATVVAAESTNPSAGWLRILAHPAAEAVASILLRAGQASPVRQCIVQVMEPASERGKAGIAELQQQTSSLLAFKALEKKVFDAQLSFNVLPQYGEDAPLKLVDIEHRIERHVASILAAHPRKATPPLPSIRLIQVPVFHGYSISFWLEFEDTVTAQQVSEAIASAQIEVRGSGEEAPNNVSAANQSGLITGDIRVDANNPRAVWIWAVSDNLQVMADAVAHLIKSSDPQ